MRTAAVPAIAAVLVLAGCAAAPSGSLPDGLRFTSSGRHVLLLHPHEDAAGDALLVGRLGVNARGCLSIGADVLVVDAAARLPDPDHVEIGGRRLALGAVVRGGGGTPGALSPALASRLRSLCGTTALRWFTPIP